MSGATVADMLADLLGSREDAKAEDTAATAANPAKALASACDPGDSEAANGLRIVANPGPTRARGTLDSQTFAADSQGLNRPAGRASACDSQHSQDSQRHPATSHGPAQSDDREAFEEHASILELDAGLSRTRAGVTSAAMLVPMTREPPAKADPRRYRVTKAEGDAAHADPWDDAGIARFLARGAALRRRGFGPDDADDLAERLHLLDMQAEGQTLCLDCVHLAGSVATGWRCGGHRQAQTARDVPAELVTMAQRCPGFRARGDPA